MQPKQPLWSPWNKWTPLFNGKGWPWYSKPGDSEILKCLVLLCQLATNTTLRKSHPCFKRWMRHMYSLQGSIIGILPRNQICPCCKCQSEPYWSETCNHKQLRLWWTMQETSTHAMMQESMIQPCEHCRRLCNQIMLRVPLLLHRGCGIMDPTIN